MKNFFLVLVLALSTNLYAQSFTSNAGSQKENNNSNINNSHVFKVSVKNGKVVSTQKVAAPSNNITETSSSSNVGKNKIIAQTMLSGTEDKHLPNSTLTENVDLILSSLTIIDVFGPKIVFEYTILNVGPGTIPSNMSWTDISLVPPSGLPISVDLDVHNFQLAAGESQSIRKELDVSANPAGLYQLKVTVAVDVSLTDTNTGNDLITYSSVTIAEGSFDLAVTNLTINDWLGPNISLSYNINNYGTGNIPSFTFCDKIYLSTSPIPLETDPVIGFYSNPEAIPGGGNSQINHELNTSSVPDGSYYLTVYVDAATVVEEISEINNYETTASAMIQQSASSDFDLSIAGPTIIDFEGPDISYNFVITNLGSSGIIPVNTFFVNSYLSPDADVTTSDYLIDSFLNGIEFAPGACASSFPSVSISGVPDGTYYLGVIIDPTNVVTETIKTNNTGVASSPQIQVSNAVPSNYDLVISDLTLTDADGPEIGFSFTISNNGSTGSIGTRTFYSEAFLSTDPIITNSDFLVYRYLNETELAPGSNINITANSVSISHVSDGTYYLGVFADASNNISESNEDNNTRVTPDASIHVTAGDNFDLALTDLNITDWVGDEIQCSYKILNTGTHGSIPINTFVINSFLSEDNVITGADYLVGSYWNDTEINIGGMAEQNPVMIVAGVPDGNYYLGIVLDMTNTVLESNETNNITVSASSNIQISGSTDVAEEKMLPTDFVLFQNYPNPFNPSTNIQYQLPCAGFVTLKVYDVLGNEVNTIVNEYQSAGTYNYQFSVFNNQLPSGTYFYRLTSDNYSATKKLVLVK